MRVLCYNCRASFCSNIAAITVLNIFVMRRKEELRKKEEKAKKEAANRSRAEQKTFGHDYPTSGKKSVFAFLVPPKKDKCKFGS
uniref:Uncharacterized protein n=1 Tax=Timema bartmani TaxID=61472 RepID=A0A7R9FDC7_9NEOP|nr:unnamed protein product [Timema bartmani]